MTRQQWIGLVIVFAPIVALIGVGIYSDGWWAVLQKLAGAVLAAVLVFGWIFGLALLMGDKR